MKTAENIEQRTKYILLVPENDTLADTHSPAKVSVILIF